MTVLTSKLILSLVDQVTAPARAVSAALNRLQAAHARNNARLDATRGRMIEAAAVGYALARSLTAPVRAATDLETKLEDIAQKVDAPLSELPKLGSEVRQVARDTTQTAADIAEGMDVLAGMGANRADSLDLLGPIGRAATAYNAEIADLSQAGYAALDNLKVPANEFGRALDAMAQAGKAGAFELKDMAKYFPQLGAGYQALGQTGVPAVADLSAALQIVRKGTGDSASAATNLANILQKMRAPQTVKAFKKMGVDLETELAAAAERGLTPIEAISEITNKTLKGDLSRLGYLFSDAQVQAGLRPLLQNIEEYRRIRAEAMAAQGVVEEDYRRRLQTGAAAARRWQIALENLNVAIGAALLPALAALGDTLVPIVNRISAIAEAHPELTRAVVATTAALIGLRVAAIAAQFSLLWMKGGLLSGAIFGMKGLAAVTKAIAAPLLARTAVSSARALLAQRQAAYAAALALQTLARRGGVAGVTLKQATASVAAAGRSLVQAQAGMKAANAGLLSLGFAGRAIAFIPSLLAPIGAIVTGIGAAIAAITAPVWAVIAVVVAAVAALALAVYNYWVPISEFVTGFASVVGGAVAEIASSLVGLAGKIASAVGSWATDRLIDFAAWIGIDEETVRRSLAGAIAALAAPLETIVTMVREVPAKIGNWLSDIFTMNTYSDADTNGFREAGERVGQALVDGVKSTVTALTSWIGDFVGSVGNWDGIRSKIDEMVAWFSGLPGRIAAAVGSIDLGSLITWPSSPEWMSQLVSDVASLGERIAAAGANVTGFAGDVVKAVADLPGKMAKAIDGVPALITGKASEMVAAGAAFAQSLWDGIRSKIDEMVAWFSGLPGRIAAAVGSIDLGSLITWPKPPAWVSRLWGGGQEEEAPAPASDAAQGATGEAASRITAEAAAANDNAQDAINTMLAGMDRLAGGVTSGGASAVAAADAVGAAISDNISVTAKPVIDTSSIDAARAKIDALSRSLQSMPSTAVTATSSALAGARASGGPVKAGGSYLVGEEGPEIVTFGRDGFVHDAMKTARIIRNAALASAGMALPAAAMPTFEMPELPKIELQLPRIEAPSVTLPDVRMPAVPQVDWPQNQGGQRGDERREAPRVEIQIASGAITVTAAAGQSPERVAEEVERRLTARLNALSRGAFSDGAN